MNKYNPIYYLLIVLLIMGGFASMAQNDYGIEILGLVATVFGFLFIIQFMQVLMKKDPDRLIALMELGGLSVLSIILAMRVFYIRFQLVEEVFGATGLLLIGVYIIKLIRSWNTLSDQIRTLAIMVALFHTSIILYVASMITVPFIPQIADLTGGLAFAMLLGFVMISLWNKDTMMEGERVTGFSYVLKFKDRSVVLLSLFVLFTAYMGLTKVGVLPKMYSAEYPQAYFQLVNQAESGDEKPVNGKYQHEEFKEMYDRFVSRNSSVSD